MIKKNIIANAIGRVWGIISVYLFIPLYLKYLGIEAYGLVGFYSTLIGILTFADIGLTATLSREMARLSIQKETENERKNIIRTYEIIYCNISILLALIIWLLSPIIANRWLNASALSIDSVTSAIRLMGIAIALQMPAHLYSGGLLGLQKQVLSNSIQIGWGLMRGVGSVLILWLVSPTIIAFASWQIISNLFYCVAVRTSLWRALPFSIYKPHFSSIVIRNTWRYASGMAGLSFLAAIIKQTDKLVVSNMLPLETFGLYSLASSLAIAPLILAGPIGIAIFPRLTGSVACGDVSNLKRLYHQACKLVSVTVFPAALTLSIYADKFIYAWTGSLDAAKKVGMVASLLILGSVIQAISVIPYYLALSHGNVKINLFLNIAIVLLITPLLILLITKYGIIGGGLSWLIMNIITLPIYMYYLHRSFLPDEINRWIIRDVGIPIIIATPIIVLSRILFNYQIGRMMILVHMGIVWCISVIAMSIIMQDIRKYLLDIIIKMYKYIKRSNCRQGTQ